ncbi:rab gtpase 2c [Stylonychia lemnae]|uniref:Rab gtpase 2c n=1 Tax=Stylonychia lemnae TaxID=5949 RepID=A0A078AY81_STYLE|nr:rab gtpase 2c [Stylonychia lemnae]|eukprot:CDW86177.1 rab gtpase 2c [Stylonychia lemnae]
MTSKQTNSQENENATAMNTPLLTASSDLDYSCDIYQDPQALSNMRFDATFKLILIGNSGVGKSCIIKRIGHNRFSEEHEVTIGAEFTTIVAHVNKKSFIKLQFWDSCGQERFNSITRIFYRGSSCVLLVYEVNNASTLRDLETIWINDIQSNLKDALIILVGNKADIDENQKTKFKRQVTQEEGLEFMKRHNIDHYVEVSAKTGYGIKPLVEYISKQLYHHNRDNLYEFKESETGSQVSYKSRRSSNQSMQSGGNPSPLSKQISTNSINMTSAGNRQRTHTNMSSKSSTKFSKNDGRLKAHSVSSLKNGSQVDKRSQCC